MNAATGPAANGAAVEQRDDRPALAFSTCFGWGLASFVIAVVNNTFNFVLLRYLTDMVGISSAFAGGTLAIAKIVDASIHPAVGALSDRAETRWGRRRPFVPLGGLICAVAILVVFNLHLLDSVRWAMIFSASALIVYGIGYAFVLIPAIAMSAEMTNHVEDRLRLVSMRVYMLGVGQLIGSSLAPILLSVGGSPRAAYSWLSFFIALIALVGCALFFLLTRNARATQASKTQHIPLRERLRLAVSNRPFMTLLAIKFVFWTGVATTNGLSAYYTKYVLGMSDAWLGTYNALKMVGWILSQELWIRLAASRGKRFGFGAAAICYALAYATWLGVGGSVTEVGLCVRAVLIGIGTGGIAFNAQAMLPDTIQYDHHVSGLRREGVFSGFYSLVETAAFSFGITLIGVLLASAGYVSSVTGNQVQPASAIAMIGNAYILIPIGSALLSPVVAALLRPEPHADGRDQRPSERTMTESGPMIELRQRGRALLDFEVAVRRAASRLHARAESALAAQGITAETLPEDMDARHATIDTALADWLPFRVRALLSEWCGRNHGLAARDAFDEVASEVADRLDALRQGPTRLLPAPEDFTPPAYWARSWFHRTHNGWDDHPYQGAIHGELVHKQYVSKVFPGDLYAARRTLARVAPRADYRQILEIGTSSGHYTVALSEVFPESLITGIDPSVRMLEQAQRIGNMLGREWTLHVGVGERTGFADDSFDLVTAYAVHHELPPRAIDDMFREALRILRPGGDLLIADVPRYAAIDRLAAWRFDWQAKYGGEPFWRASALLDFAAGARAAGFVDVQSGTLPPRNDTYYVLGRKPA